MMLAFAIWEVGVPRITLAAEQREVHSQGCAPAAEQRFNHIENNTIAILNWLDGAARSILAYKEVPSYQEARRRAGSRRGARALTDREQSQRADLRRAQANVR